MKPSHLLFKQLSKLTETPTPLDYQWAIRDYVWNNITIKENKKFIDELVFPDDFPYCSGSAKPEHHHFGESGLVIHTLEVLVVCNEMSKLYDVNRDILLISALFHDWGKMWDYQRVGYKEGRIFWGAGRHKRYIHHISRSAIEFNKLAEKSDLDETFRDEVTHCILSHHGKREHGSPVSPKSKEAWVLHLADSLSARMDDYHKFEVF